MGLSVLACPMTFIPLPQTWQAAVKSLSLDTNGKNRVNYFLDTSISIAFDDHGVIGGSFCRSYNLC